jgi:hypothetical protein
VWDDQQAILEGETTASLCGCGGYVGFGINLGSSSASVEMAVGISFISVEQAIANLNGEFGAKNNFDSILSQAQVYHYLYVSNWFSKLGKKCWVYSRSLEEPTNKFPRFTVLCTMYWQHQQPLVNTVAITWVLITKFIP